MFIFEHLLNKTEINLILIFKNYKNNTNKIYK